MEKFRPGLNLDDIEHTSDGEIKDHLQFVWQYRGPLYRLYSSSLMADYAPPFAKLHWRGVQSVRLAGQDAPLSTNIVLLSCQNIHSYMMLGWETGILNEFYELQRVGMAKAQIMELVMFSQLYAGMRGLGHVYRAVGDFLPAFGEPKAPLEFPAVWAPDPDAFKSGLDLSTREMTKADLENLTGWYEKTIGYLPKSIAFGLKYHPEFVKVNRAKWEVAIKTLPKQVAPYMMIRHNTITQSVEGLREAVLLAKAWGMSRDYVIGGIAETAFYFTGFEGFYAASEALEEILDGWE